MAKCSRPGIIEIMCFQAINDLDLCFDLKDQQLAKFKACGANQGEKDHLPVED